MVSKSPRTMRVGLGSPPGKSHQEEPDPSIENPDMFKKDFGL